MVGFVLFLDRTLQNRILVQDLGHCYHFFINVNTKAPPERKRVKAR